MDSIRPKSPEELQAQVAAAEESAGAPLVSHSHAEHMDTPAAELKELHPARYANYVKLLRAMKRAEHDEQQGVTQDIKDIGHSFRLLNGVAEYLKKVESGEEKTLYPRQVESFEKIAHFLERGNTEGYVKLPTGVGKTVIFAELLEAFAKSAGSRVLVVGPTKIILHQNKWKLDEFGDIEAGSYYGDEKDLKKPVTVTTYHSLRNLVEQGKIKEGDFDVLILDEAHKAIGEKTAEAIEKLGERTIKIGFTATPEFHEEKSVADLLPIEIDTLGLPEAIKGNLLSSLRVYVVKTEKDLSKIERTGKDYDAGELEKELNNPDRNRHIVDTYRRFDEVNKKMTIAYCAGREHAKALRDEFLRQGFSAEYIDGNTNWAQREEILGRFKNGATQILCNADLLVEGLDEPEAEVCLNAAPTMSKVVAEQRGGRILRRSKKKDKKTGIVLEFYDDYGENENTPVLFSEIAGAAALDAGEKLKNEKDEPILPEEELQLEHEESAVVPGVMSDPKEIMNLTNRNRRFRYDRAFEYAPKDWVHPRRVAHELGIREEEIRDYASTFDLKHSDWFKRYLTPTDIYTTHYHPDLVNSIVRHFAPEFKDMETVKEFSRKREMPDKKAETLLQAVDEAGGLESKSVIGTKFYDKSQTTEQVIAFEKERRARLDMADRHAEKDFFADDKSSEAEKERKYWERVDESPSEAGDDEPEESDAASQDIPRSEGEEEVEHVSFDDDAMRPEREDDQLSVLSSELQKALELLPKRERKILELIYFEGRTLAEIGKMFNVTGSAIGRIEGAALMHMRHPARIKFISPDRDISGGVSLENRDKLVYEETVALFKEKDALMHSIFKASGVSEWMEFLAFSVFKDKRSIESTVFSLEATHRPQYGRNPGANSAGRMIFGMSYAFAALAKDQSQETIAKVATQLKAIWEDGSRW